MKTIKVIIATPRPVERSRLARTLAGCAGVKVLSEVSDLSQTYTDAESKEPDVVIMANEFFNAEEFSCMKSLYYALGARWVPIGTALTPRKAIIFNDGSVRPEPMIWSGMGPDTLLNELQLAMSIRRKESLLARKPAALPKSALRDEKVVLIGASTGGIDALLAVLACFPANCPPTAIVQHTGQAFLESLIRLLDRRCAARVVAAEEGMSLTSGMICIAGKEGGHLRLRHSGGFTCSVRTGPLVSGHTPSVDALFQSAVGYASRVIAVLLTGMGRDGADGLLELHKAGAMTIGQNEATSVVYGMPRVAWELGAVRHQLALDRIGPEILRLASRPSADPVTTK